MSAEGWELERAMGIASGVATGVLGESTWAALALCTRRLAPCLSDLQVTKSLLRSCGTVYRYDKKVWYERSKLSFLYSMARANTS